MANSRYSRRRCEKVRRLAGADLKDKANSSTSSSLRCPFPGVPAFVASNRCLLSHDFGRLTQIDLAAVLIALMFILPLLVIPSQVPVP